MRRPDPPALPSHVYEYNQSLHWENPYTTKVREALADPKLCMAWNPKAGCWCMARKVMCHVKYGKLAPVLLEVPFIWGYWVGPDGEPLSPEDPRLILTIRAGDLQTRGVDGVIGDIEADEARREADTEKANADKHEEFSDRLRHVLKKVDVGATRHRPLGTAGGKISTAALWRSGAGA